MIPTLEIFCRYAKKIKLAMELWRGSGADSPSSCGALTVVKYVGVEDDLEVSGWKLDIIIAHLLFLAEIKWPLRAQVPLA